jgi:CubicO group peptidase (beta-lactamase class C family)
MRLPTVALSGKIRGELQPIVELLPRPADSIANPDPRKQKITVGDLLSMRSGLDCDDRNSASLGNDSAVALA